MPTQQRPDMARCKRFQSLRLPFLHDLDGKVRRNILVLRRNDEQRRTRRSLHLDSCVCRPQHAAGFIAPVPACIQSSGVIRIRQSRPRGGEACIALPRRYIRPLPPWKLAMPRRRWQRIHYDNRIGLRGNLQGKQAAKAGTDHHARTRQGEQCLGHLLSIVLQRSRHQAVRRSHQIRRMHVEAMRLQHATPDIPFPSTATGAVDEQCVAINQPAWLPASPVPPARAR